MLLKVKILIFYQIVISERTRYIYSIFFFQASRVAYPLNCFDSCNKNINSSKFLPSVRMQRSICRTNDYRTPSNISTVVKIAVNAFWIPKAVLLFILSFYKPRTTLSEIRDSFQSFDKLFSNSFYLLDLINTQYKFRPEFSYTRYVPG